MDGHRTKPSMRLGLEDQVAVIVGGANGIGLAIAKAFAEEQAKVAILDIDPNVPDIAATVASEFDVAAAGIPCDMCDLEQVREAERSIQEELGRASHLVFAGGVGSGKFGFPFWNLEPSDWDRIVKVNLIGPVTATHAFVPTLTDGNGGTVLFLSSVAGQMGSQTDPPYSAAKAGIINFAQCAAKDLAEYDVRVNTICPGMVKTNLNQSVWAAWNEQKKPEDKMTYEQWGTSKVKNVSPLGRWQEPSDIASMAVFLASDQARNVTGQTVNVDGGQIMHW